ncbi:MAG TPA: type II toxin-antitoxin system VapC family toxin [Archaeoglobus veneficus]|nr:type II toxin-antitoxin system VapC family toxin [Archaeoglobus veneficus]
MILDTTYLLPLAGIGVDTDLLKAVFEDKAKLRLEDFSVSLISIFELQAKAAKLKVPVSTVLSAVKTITKVFKVIPFYDVEVIDKSFELRKHISDYIDCIIVATAIVLKKDLVTEDTLIHENKKLIKENYGVNIFDYKSLVKST